MKKTLTLILMCYSMCLLAQQNGYAYYSKKNLQKIEEENLPKSNVDIDLKSHYESINKSLQKLAYVLTFSSSKASYNETKKLNTSNNELYPKLAKVISGFKGNIFYDIEANVILHQKEFAGKTFLIESEIKKMSWTLTREKLIINGFTCYKAIGKEQIEGSWGNKQIKIVAWYTPDIPINFGPDGYANLPGLILQIERGEIATYLTKIEFCDDDLIIKKPIKGRKVTKAIFKEIVKTVSLNRKENYSKN